MLTTPTIIALVPARSGSKRIPEKNIRPLGAHPLISYTIAATLESKIFSRVIVSTDSEKIAEIARYYGAEVPFLRPAEYAGELSSDIEWVEYTLKRINTEDRDYDCFSILRPTNPFRQAKTILRAWNQFIKEKEVDSLRAVEKAKQHPGKMWIVKGNRMFPLLTNTHSGQPWHSCQYQALPEVYAQNASLEIAWTRVVFETFTISGNVIVPFFTEGYEGFDINQPDDWILAEELIKKGKATLTHIAQKPYCTK